MYSLFYLYAIVYAIHKIYRLFYTIFGKKKDKPFNIDLTNLNLPKMISSILSVDLVVAICNFIWLIVGLCNHEHWLFALIIFLDVIVLASAFKTGAEERKPLIIINTLVKLAISVFIIYTHFFI